MNETRVAILGMGLMGGSMAWAIKDAAGTLVASDPDDRTRTLVREANIVQEIRAHPQDILPGADVILLAAPVGEILNLIPRLPGWHSGEPLVLDLGSTKSDICQRLDELPDRFDVLGGHPMCGKAVGGFEQADPDLFRDAPLAFTALERTTDRARSFAKALASHLGAHPLWIEAGQHDAWVGATSHLPYLLSVAQVLVTPEQAAPLIGTGFQSATRLASTPRTMMLDVLSTNRAALLEHLERVQGVLGEIDQFIREGEMSELKKILDKAAALKSRFERGRS